MIWKFSDGTTVELGGKVEGATLLAQRLRSQLAEPQSVGIWPPPCGYVALDLDDPALLNRYLRDCLDYWQRVRKLPLSLQVPDGVPPLLPPPWEGNAELAESEDADAIH
jgi:hypothetical protein